MGIISWDLNGSLVQELYSPEPSTGPWLRKTPITEHPIRYHSGLGLGYYYYFIYCRTRFRNSNETNRPVDQMTRSRRKWTVVGIDTLQSLHSILRGQINLRLPVPRYIIKLSSDFRTAIRQRELLRPFFLDKVGWPASCDLNY